LFLWKVFTSSKGYALCFSNTTFDYISWKYRTNPKEARKFANNLKGRPSEKHSKFKIWTIEEFPIPGFVSFSEEDPVVKKYHQQRKRITKIYKGKDFVKVSLDKLTE